MIRRPWNEDKWLLVTMEEHARVASLIAAAWVGPNGKLPEEVLLAVARHESGWRDEDSSPRINAEGAPLAYQEIDVAQSFGPWRRSVRLLLDDKRFYAARLSAMFYSEQARASVNLVKSSPRTVAALGQFLGEMKMIARRTEELAREETRPEFSRAIDERDLMKFAQAPGQSVAAHLRFMQVCHELALLLCGPFQGELDIPNVPFLAEGDTLHVSRLGDKVGLTVSPLPFRKNLRDHLSAVIIPRRLYKSDEELRLTIGEVSNKTIEFHIGSPQ
ncbi:MAG: DUF3891 family protein [Candidatus Sumerlaeaceae bacterium]|nr:DUF3891 family protein [Candidatus Sumerlaeaceae bacterium]